MRQVVRCTPGLPSTGMNNTQIANPVVTLGPEIDSIIYTVTVSTPEGCSAKDNMKSDCLQINARYIHTNCVHAKQ